MANTQLFMTRPGKRRGMVQTINLAGGAAYRYDDRHMLAQYAVTGCMNGTYYAGAGEQLAVVLGVAQRLDPAFLAKTALYARLQAGMKDMPALLLAVLAAKDVELLRRVFPRVIDDARMLRNFVQIVRSGVTGRKSLGSAPKALVQQWLLEAPDRKLIEGCVGQNPSLADVVRMVHPKPADASREALFGWLLGKPHVFDRLPPALQSYVLFRNHRGAPVPDVPFQMLADLGLTSEEWAEVARRGGWHMLRMNLNTFARHGVFDVPGMDRFVAQRLRDPEAIRKARALPYQLLAAYRAASGMPSIVADALQEAMECALGNVPRLPGRVVVCPDVSGSMSSPVSGFRRGASSAVRCVDVAALVAASVLRKNEDALLLPFENEVRVIDLDPRADVMANADRLAGLCGGGTACSAPLKWLNRREQRADLVIYVSDNQSWTDETSAPGTSMMAEWAAFNQRNPRAKLVCIDIQAHGTTQAQERIDVMNVGGFSDAVFTAIERFAANGTAAAYWIDEIEAVQV